MTNKTTEPKSNLRTAQERIAALRLERQEQTLAAIRRVQAQQTVEIERRKLAVPSVLKFEGLAAEVWQQQDVQEYLDQERASLDESEAPGKVNPDLQNS